MSRGYHIGQGRYGIFLSLNSFIGQCCSGLVNNAPDYRKDGGGTVGWFLWWAWGYLNDFSSHLVFSAVFTPEPAAANSWPVLRHCCINWIAFLIASLRFNFLRSLGQSAFQIPSFCYCPLFYLCAYVFKNKPLRSVHFTVCK